MDLILDFLKIFSTNKNKNNLSIHENFNEIKKLLTFICFSTKCRTNKNTILQFICDINNFLKKIEEILENNLTDKHNNSDTIDISDITVITDKKSISDIKKINKMFSCYKFYNGCKDVQCFIESVSNGRQKLDHIIQSNPHNKNYRNLKIYIENILGQLYKNLQKINQNNNYENKNEYDCSHILLRNLYNNDTYLNKELAPFNGICFNNSIIFALFFNASKSFINLFVSERSLKINHPIRLLANLLSISKNKNYISNDYIPFINSDVNSNLENLITLFNKVFHIDTTYIYNIENSLFANDFENFRMELKDVINNINTGFDESELCSLTQKKIMTKFFYLYDKNKNSIGNYQSNSYNYLQMLFQLFNIELLEFENDAFHILDNFNLNYIFNILKIVTHPKYIEKNSTIPYIISKKFNIKNLYESIFLIPHNVLTIGLLKIKNEENKINIYDLHNNNFIGSVKTIKYGIIILQVINFELLKLVNGDNLPLVLNHNNNKYHLQSITRTYGKLDKSTYIFHIDSFSKCNDKWIYYDSNLKYPQATNFKVIDELLKVGPENNKFYVTEAMLFYRKL